MAPPAAAPYPGADEELLPKLLNGSIPAESLVPDALWPLGELLSIVHCISIQLSCACTKLCLAVSNSCVFFCNCRTKDEEEW